MKFYCEDTETKTASGEVTMRGVKWNEGSPFLEFLAGVTSGAMCLLGLFMVFAAPTALGKLAAIGIFIAGGWIGMIGREHKGTARSIQFFADGRIQAPLGFYDYPRETGLWRFTLADIKSIEVRQFWKPDKDGNDYLTHGVRMIMRRGDIVHAASRLSENDAFMVATRLNDAVEATRAAMADGAVSGVRDQHKAHAKIFD